MPQETTDMVAPFSTANSVGCDINDFFGRVL
jgi:hypothetical protein